MAESRELLTVAATAVSPQMNQQTLRNWIARGSLPALRIGRPVRVRQSDGEALLEANSTGSTQPPPASGAATCRHRSRPART